MKGKFFTTVLVIAMLALPIVAQTAESSDDVTIKTKVITTGGEPKYEFKIKYLPGKYLLTMSNQGKVSQSKVGDAEADSMLQGMETSMEMKMLMTVSDFDDKGIKTLTMEYQSFKMASPMGSMSMTREQALVEMEKEAASSQPSTPAGPEQMAQGVYKSLMASTIVVEMNRDDKVVSVKGFDKIFDSMKGNPMAAAMGQQMKKSLSDQMLKDFMNVGKTCLPDKSVGIGGKWVNTMTMPIPMLGKMGSEMTMNLEKVQKTPNGKVAIIKTSMKMNKAGDDMEQANPMVQLKNMEADLTGSMVFNFDMGIATSYTQTGNMDMTMSAGPQNEIKISQEMTTTTTVKKIK